MNTNLSPALDLLDAVSAAREEALSRVLNLLPVHPASPVRGILVAEPSRFNRQPIRSALEDIATILQEHVAESSVTDWPFQNFWRPPYEPDHSKLLGYFLDPKEPHDHGPFLLKTFLKVLGDAVVREGIRVQNPFVGTIDRCIVVPESRDTFGQIDLWILRSCDAPKCAIIVENKINRAPNQPNQLDRYVKRAEDKGFQAEEIFVFFLPRMEDEDLDPDPRDRAAIQGRAEYLKISFEKHILDWLKQVDNKSPSQQLDGRIQQHISYYRILIEFLIRERKQQTMNIKMLKTLEASDSKGPLPSWAEIVEVTNSAGELKVCFRLMRCRKTLREVQALLKPEANAVLYVFKEQVAKEFSASSEYDDANQGCICVCVPATDTLGICFGWDTGDNPEEAFWIGYVRLGLSDKEEEKNVANEQGREYFRNPESEWRRNAPYYAWEYRRDLNFDNCVENAGDIAAQLLDMRAKLQNRLKH